jgi:hypothetical protein
MRYHMKVVGQANGIRGTVKTLNPQSGAFSVEFDVPLTGDNGLDVKTVSFTQADAVITDATWGLNWVVIS